MEVTAHGKRPEQERLPRMYKFLRRKQKRVEESKKDEREYYKNGNRTETLTLPWSQIFLFTKPYKILFKADCLLRRTTPRQRTPQLRLEEKAPVFSPAGQIQQAFKLRSKRRPSRIPWFQPSETSVFQRHHEGSSKWRNLKEFENVILKE